MKFDSASIPAEALLQHQEFVRNLARRLVRDEDSAGDVVQETWLAALSHAPRSVESAQAWLAAIVRNRAYNRQREESRGVHLRLDFPAIDNEHWRRQIAFRRS